MKALIIHAHENPDSYCSTLKNEAKKVLEIKGYEVIESDLYAINFNPVASKKDFKVLTGEYYKIQNEQKNASINHLFSEDISAEMEKVLGADFILFTFPLWWFSMPAILKGWVDRVMAFGFSYGDKYGVYDNGRFKDKKAICIITTGGPEHIYTKEAVHKTDKEAMLHHIQHNIFKFNGITPLEPFVVFGAARLTDEERKAKIEALRGQIEKLF